MIARDRKSKSNTLPLINADDTDQRDCQNLKTKTLETRRNGGRRGNFSDIPNPCSLRVRDRYLLLSAYRYSDFLLY